MQFRLCLALGFAHPDRLLASLSAFELAEWYAYASIEPFGDLRADFRAGMVCATVANYSGNRRNDELPSALPSDFMHTLPVPVLAVKEKPKAEGMLMDDPAEQAALIRRAIFKVEE